MASEDSVWPRLPIGRIAEPRLGGNYRNTESVSGRPLIKMGNIARGSIDLSRIEYIPDTETVSPSHRLQYGDVLFNTRNTLDLVGKVSIWRDELPVAYYNSNILRLEFKSDYCGDSRYFGYALNSAESIEAIRNLATGTTSVAAVYTRDLLKLEVPVPSKSEQRAIADTLESVGRLISVLERRIAKKQAIKRGMLQQLLTGKTTLRGSPESGDEAALGRITTWLSGGTPDRNNPAYWGGTIPWISAATLRRSRVHDSDQYLTEAGVRAGSKLAPTGATLVLVRGMALHRETRIGMATRPVSFNQDVKALIPQPGVLPEYLVYALQARSTQVLDLVSSAGSGTGVLDTQLLQRLPIWVPDEITQRRIVTAIDAADRNIEVLDRLLAKMQAIKQGMMQQLLIGRTRLPVKESAA
ncbi:restriction endonuclease subunit S [Streptomyces sp. SAI-041]|uniref:restriction endonuclease subunit S n=1 Tax=Streptomyces sp. SAI-041 TaxID=2940548 RepID=UPI002476E224|nr:restriction endonuclease subunit S [Streptomyces sp. SAI-041]MDH6548706.1 type I restriction enzyme S subunit [Streptomyces sp. SAI-041]